MIRIIGSRRSFSLKAGACVLALGLTGLLASKAIQADAPKNSPTKPEYNQMGELIPPIGFRTWVFVGSDLSPVYKKDLPQSTKREQDRNTAAQPDNFHNIYINPEAYREFVATGRFPDPTILVMEVFAAAKKDPGGILTSGLFEDKRTSFEVAVKDSKHPKDGVEWAYYAFDLDDNQRPTVPATAMPKNLCYDCHKIHASVDNVWVQFYPALRNPE